jgi:hypothetical protein
MAVSDGLTPWKSLALATWRGTPGRSPSGQVLGCNLGHTGLFARTAAPELAPSPPPPLRSHLLTPPVRDAAGVQPAGEQRLKYRSHAGRDDTRSSSGAATDRLQGGPRDHLAPLQRHPSGSTHGREVLVFGHAAAQEDMWTITHQAVAEIACRRGFRHSAQCLWHAHSHTSVPAEATAVHVVARQQSHSGAATATFCNSAALLKRCLEPHACGRKRQRQPGGTGCRWADAEVYLCFACMTRTCLSVPRRSSCNSQLHRTVSLCLLVHHLAGFLRLAPAGSSAADVGWQVRRGVLPASGQVISLVHKLCCNIMDLHSALWRCIRVLMLGRTAERAQGECAKRSCQSMWAHPALRHSRCGRPAAPPPEHLQHQRSGTPSRSWRSCGGGCGSWTRASASLRRRRRS